MFRVMKPVVTAATVGAMAVCALGGAGTAGAQARAQMTRSAGVAAHVTSAKKLPAVLNCSSKRLVRPGGEVVLACGDGNAMITKTHWSSWTATQATGVTEFYLNPCSPNCVAGSMKEHSNATVRLYDVVSTKHGSLFTRAAITYRSHGKTHKLTFDLVG